MGKKTLYLLILIVFGISLWAFSCGRQPGAIYVKDGREYGKIKSPLFRHKFWNYYERGLSYAEGDFYNNAAADLLNAIKLREKDQRMARTYGMHFVDYFPHRELGVIHYKRENFSEAKNELNLSIAHYPSAKAYFYLDLVRKALIKKEQKETPPPEIILDFKKNLILTREDPVKISGKVRDENYVADISINNIPLFLERSKKQIDFSRNLNLSQGMHGIEVTAKNLGGKVSERKIRVFVDRLGPVLTLKGLTSKDLVPGKAITISGSIYDESKVADLLINNTPVSIKKQNNVSFLHTIKPFSDTLNIRVRDKLGNETLAEIPLGSDQAYNKAPVLLAGLDSKMGLFITASLFGSDDTEKPVIEIKDWTETQTVFLEKIYLEGCVRDESDIVKLFINNRPVLRQKGSMIFFNHFVRLEKEKNIIIIKAEDAAGNKSIKKISIIKRTPKTLLLDERMRLTILPFDQKGIISSAGFSFQDSLINAFVSRNRFRVVERDILDMIMQEQKISQTKLIQREQALKLGKLASAQSVVAGSIIETRSGVEIVSRVIDTETSEILTTKDVYGEVKDLTAFKKLALGMASKVHQEFPLTGGVVLEKKGSTIFTDLGREEIRAQRRIIIYREEPVKHPVTGKILGADQKILGKARVIKVDGRISKAVLTDNKKEIAPMHKVITE